MKKILWIVLTLFMPVALTSCGNDDPGVEEGPNQKPECRIISPGDGEIYNLAEGLIVRGTFSDPEDKIRAVVLSWTGGSENAIASSPFVVQIPADGLTAGNMVITLEVEDDAGHKAEHSVTVELTGGGGVIGDVLVDGRDGNRYRIVEVGGQVWMAENLRYLPRIDNDVDTYEPRVYVFEYTGTDIEQAKSSPYYSQGVFYNFYGALDGDSPGTGDQEQYVRGVCPEGWHLPRQSEWIALRDHIIDNDLIALDYAGRPIEDALGKAVASKDGWVYPPFNEVPPADGHPAKDPELNNATGMDGKPAGFLGADNLWYHEGLSCGWWSCELSDTDYYSKPTRIWSNEVVFHVNIWDFHTSCALPVRCLKNR